MGSHDANAALPSGDDADKGLLRKVLVQRSGYTLADDDDPTDLTPVDSVSGAVALALSWKGVWFWYDADDSTTAHDGTTCIVTADSKRYKVNTFAPGTRVVADKDTTAQPSSPTAGDAYLIPSGATGDDWAGHDDDIGVYTARGWQFEAPYEGRLLYVNDEDEHYKYTSDGEWALALAPGDQGIKASNLNAGMRRDWLIENQTTDTPPTSVAQGTAYIIGDSPTGDWSGQSGKIAVREASGSGATDKIYTPREGDQAYDKATNSVVIWNGTAWGSAASGSVLGSKSVATASGSSTAPTGTSPYTYSNSTAPTTSHRRRIDEASLTYAATASDSRLRFNYRGFVDFSVGGSGSASNGTICIALYRDSETNAVDWVYIADLNPEETTLNALFEIDADDTDSHTYKVAITSMYTSSSLITDADAPGRRLFEVIEYAA